MPHRERRLEDGTHIFDLVESRAHQGGITTALIQRNRMRNLPPSGDSRNGSLGQIGLQDHLGVADVAACLFDPATGALCVQRGRSGLSHATIKKLINSARDADFIFDPVLSEDAMTRLVHLQEAEKLTIKFAIPRAASHYAEAGGGIGDVAKFMARQGAMVVKVEVAPAGKGDRLSKRGVWDLIREATSLSDLEDGFRLKALSVKGANDDGNSELVDFINERFKAQAEMEEHDGRHTDPEHLRTQIRAAYREQRQYIQRYSSQASTARATSGD